MYRCFGNLWDFHSISGEATLKRFASFQIPFVFAAKCHLFASVCRFWSPCCVAGPTFLLFEASNIWSCTRLCWVLDFRETKSFGSLGFKWGNCSAFVFINDSLESSAQIFSLSILVLQLTGHRPVVHRYRCLARFRAPTVFPTHNPRNSGCFSTNPRLPHRYVFSHFLWNFPRGRVDFYLCEYEPTFF